MYTNTSTLISPTLASKFCGIPSIFHLHEIPISSKLYTKFLSAFFNIFSTKVIAVSNSVRNYWIENGLMHKKIITVYNGFNFNFTNRKNNVTKKIIFTSISRIIPYKGHNFQIELFKKIIQKRKDVILQIVGDTLPYYRHYKESLENLVSYYKLDNNITFLGFQNDIKSILEKSNFFIHSPVEPDPLPTVIFEAIQNKIPVISTNRGGAVEILNNGKNGFLIEPDNLEISANQILNYINNKSLQNLHVKNSYEFIKINFNYNNFKEKILSVVELLNKERL